MTEYIILRCYQTASLDNCMGCPVILQGAELDYFGSPLDTRFLHDVGYAATRLNRQKANEIVKALLAKYEDRIKAKNPPIGKKFQECNDLKTLKPTKEYLDLYDKVKKELEDLGLKFS